jgi:predicted RNA-binding Zn-ribbon protein involved in translation (DUF1610 family)
MLSDVDLSPGAEAPWLDQEFPCPACGEKLVHLSHYGLCPICRAQIAGNYVGHLAGEWVPAFATHDELCALLRDERFVLIFSLPWVDL